MSEIIILKSGNSAQLDPVQSGFAHGFGLFESIKLVDGRLCFWEAHWARLCESAQVFRLPISHDAPSVLDAIRTLVAPEGKRSGAVKLSLLKVGEGAAQLFVYLRPSMVRGKSPERVLLDVDSPQNERSPLAGHKTHNYMENMLLFGTARASGFADVVRVNTRGFLTETTVGNLFFLKNGRLCTPSLESGILPGVMRAQVLDLAKSRSLGIEVGLMRPEALEGAESVFITNSSVGIQTVDTIVTSGEELSFDSSHALVRSLAQNLSALELERATVL